MACLRLILLLLSLLSCTAGVLWTDHVTDGQLVTVCDGDDVTFPWDFRQEAGDVIFSVDWYKPGAQPTMVAFMSHGTFAPVPDYAQRAEFVANGGLRLRHVTDVDAGNYTIEVDGHDADGQFFTLRRNVVLEVKAPLKAAGLTLPLTSQPEASHNDVTDTWELRLSCGNFTHLNAKPAFTVEWTTPSGQVMNSTGYSNGRFHLTLPAPLEEGTYSCRVPQRFAGRGCLPRNITNVHNVTGHVDAMQARFALLEAKQHYLLTQNVGLTKENSLLKQRLDNFENSSRTNAPDMNVTTPSPVVMMENLHNLTSALDKQTHRLGMLAGQVHSQAQQTMNVSTTVAALKQCCAPGAGSSDAVSALTNQVADLSTTLVRHNASLVSLSTEMRMLEGIIVHDKNDLQKELRTLENQLSVKAMTDGDMQVSFHAQLSGNAVAQSGATLVLGDVFNNQGGAYDNSTGVFTAPLDGTYFFIASTGSHSTSQDAYLEIIADGTQLATAYAHRHNGTSEMATCHGIAALRRGATVHLVSLLDSLFNYADTFFTGFRIP